MTRKNLCPNPAAGANTTGWSGTATYGRVTDITGEPRTTGIRTTVDGGYVQVATGAASPGVQYTVSAYVKNGRGFDGNNRVVYLGFERSAGGTDYSNTLTVSYPNGSITRVEITATAPANTTGIHMLIDGVSASYDISAVLFEAAAGPAGSYFDGETASAVWDGTQFNSTSTLNDAATVTLTSASALLAVRGAPTTFARTDIFASLSRLLALRGSPATFADVVVQPEPIFDPSAYLDWLLSLAAASGLFDAVNGHEPKSAPGSGLACSAWYSGLQAVQSSGLIRVTVRLELQARIQASMLQEPQDDIEPMMLGAAVGLMGDLVGAYTAGGLARHVDIFGAYGESLRMVPGYINQDSKLYRVADIFVPLIVDDLWTETP